MESSGNDTKKFGYVLATVLVAAILISAAVIIAPAKVVTTTTTINQPQVTSTETVTITTTSLTNATSSPMLADCPIEVTTPWFGLLVTGASPATICFQVYEFNSTSVLTLNTTKLLSIIGFPVPHGGSVFSGIQNFTVSPSVAQVSLGGPNNTNEGTVIAYKIAAKPGASGTYFMELAGFLLGNSPGEICTGGAGQLVAGNGQPNYALPGSCIGETSTGPFSIPGVGYTVPGNTLYYRIYGAGNATQ